MSNQQSGSREPFIGTWKLVSFEFRRSDGTIVNVLGDDGQGVLMYDASGHMSGQMMRADRPMFASGDQQNASYDELKAAVAGYIAYFGDYDVDEASKTVIHHTKGAMFPNLVGHDQKRFYQFSGNQLTLTTPPTLVGGVTVTGVVLWEKVGN
jgi:hypothetical protein